MSADLIVKLGGPVFQSGFTTQPETAMNLTTRTAQPHVGSTVREFAAACDLNPTCDGLPDRVNLDARIVAVRIKAGYGGRVHILTDAGDWLVHYGQRLGFLSLRGTDAERRRWFGVSER